MINMISSCMYKLLHRMEIPLDEYWMAVGLAAYRAVITIATSLLLYRAR